MIGEKRYFIFYKPYGVLSQFTREVPDHKVIGDFYDFPREVYPVGRLDKDSEGLLFLTNDKTCIDFLLNPNNKREKTYHVQVEGDVSESALSSLRNGVEIKLPNKKMYKTQKAKVKTLQNIVYPERTPPVRFRKSIPTTWLEVKIVEGKNRQIRKMCAKVGFPVLRLIRTRLGDFDLGHLDIGEVREVNYSID